MTSPVLFLSAVESVFRGADECSIALEIGPHSALSGPFRQICKDMQQKVQYFNTVTRGANSTNTILTAVGHLYCHGLVPRFEKINAPGVTLTNLPTFPWNHSASYWHESRISREFRTREHSEHELLGTRVMGGNDLQPSWRKLLDVYNVPWLDGHVVADNIVFPAAGYMAMAGEAIRQLSKSISFTIRHFSIDSAMMLQNGHLSEIITRLQPHKVQMKLPVTSWHKFTISSFDGNKWTNNCSGEIRAGQVPSQIMTQSDVKTSIKLATEEWYRAANSTGLEYGTSFQALKNIQCAVESPTVVAEVRDDRIPQDSPYALHPVAIDQLLQCCILGSSKGRLRNMKQLILPIYISELHVSSQEGHAGLHIQAEITNRQVGSIFANGQIQTRSGKVLLQCREIRFRALDNTDSTDRGAAEKLKLLEWRPDIDLTDTSTLIQRVSDLTGCIALVEKLHLLYSIETANVLKDAESTIAHMRRFKDWNEQFRMTTQNHGSLVVQDAKVLFELSAGDRKSLISKLSDEALETPAKDVVLALARIHDNIEKIFHGKISTLSLLLADNVLMNTYNFTNMFNHKRLFQLLGHSNPKLRVLEIGAGTGGFTSTVLPALIKLGSGAQFSTYTYTDITSDFFQAAKERFHEYAGVEYIQLDISRDLANQGVQLHTYDLVIAANVCLTINSLVACRRHVNS